MIKSKIFEYGNEHESEWPPKFGTNNGKGGIYYYDKEKEQMVEGYPPNKNNSYGVAPMVVFDSMPKTYHEAACREVESRKEWARLDKEYGCITFANQKEAEKPLKVKLKEEKQGLKIDRRKAAEKALRMHRDNPKEMREKVAKQRELQESIAKKEGLDKAIDNSVNLALKGKIK
jgi:hypothetical protein